MFDWFKQNKLAPMTLPEELARMAPQINDNGYSIGYGDGVTLFKLKAGANTVTMALTPDEVYRMIRLLKASLNQDPTDETDQSKT